MNHTPVGEWLEHTGFQSLFLPNRFTAVGYKEGSLRANYDSSTLVGNSPVPEDIYAPYASPEQHKESGIRANNLPLCFSKEVKSFKRDMSR